MTDSGSKADEAWRSFSHGELEREYSPSSCVPDGDLGPFIQAYIDRSEQARAHVQASDALFTEVRYGSSASQTIDVAVPPVDAGPTALLVFIHGGYWQQLSKHESFFSGADCLDHGIAFAAIDYTLAPDASLDDIVSECHAAMLKLRTSAGQLGIDPDRIFVAGSSAGAHLTAMVAIGPSDDYWRPAGCCLVSGIFDLEPLLDTYINDAVKLDVKAAARNSPLLQPLRGFPPTIIALGSNETNEFKRQSNAMAAVLHSADTPVEQLEVAGKNHFDVILDLCDDKTPLGAAMLGLITQASR